MMTIEDDDEEESDMEVENKVIKRQKQKQKQVVDNTTMEDADEDGSIVNNTEDIKKKQLYTLLSL